ncbi:MAG: RNA 2',3'-cyclic phosphodiesterase [Calditrichaceae bacterium]|nr:RNA 2',3'-cyclic phosphodiesterase [Calditrichaceae bacterium]MBN2710005.1 RNA 2',3'-cyclic phosphodiesterase [Calditrichaceae bacterium]RQV97342.1 MAG: RNA 2',3'-cyclic phosphodiesterase [Calditrichota bacterium]
MSDDIRCFFAIALPAELKARIDEYIKELKTFNPEIKWVKADSIHITLKFLGNIRPELAEKSALQAMEIGGCIPDFKIQINTTGAFPDKRRPRVIWLGIQSVPQQPLYELNEKLENLSEPLGFEKENRRFSPHLTLGRIKQLGNYTQMWKYIEENPFEQSEFAVNEFLLMRSFLKQSGAEYKIIQKYPLRLC